MATWDTIRDLIRAIADSIDNAGAYGLRTPAEAIELQRNVEVIPGESWGSTKAFEIYLKGIAQYLDNAGISEVSAIKQKLNELITSHAQLKADYNSGTVPTSALDVDPLP